MYTQNTQQYHEFIRGFFTLFDEIKKEDNPIYNSRVGFNAVKFLIKHSTWNLDEDEDKNEACKVILQEHNKIKEDRQGLQRKAKEILNEYIYGDVNDGVKEISIYGDHASIELKDNKKEFKISEFLNSDFCQKNGISGFSTLHSDGKSGMHGFVAEEGGKKIRHYVVTDGSYEMALNWHDKNGKKCTIKIKIDKDGVDLTERNGITAEELKANKDVKIGGLFLYQIQFREKGQGREQENQQSSETFIESNSKNIGVQTHRTLSHNQDNRQEDERYDNPTFATFGHAVPGSRKPDGKENLENFQSPLAENSQNKRTPPPPPLRTSSLPNDQQKGEYQRTILSGGNGYRFPSSDPSKSTIFTKSAIHNQDNRQEDERYDNLTFATFGHAVPGSRKPDRSEQTSNNQQQPETQQQEGESEQEPKGGKLNYKKGESSSEPEANRKSELSSNTADVAQKRFLEDVLEKIKEDKPIYKWLKSKIEGKEDNQNLDALEGKLSKKYGQGNIVEKRENDDGKPLSPVSTEGNKESLIDVEQGSDTRLQKSSRRSGQEPEEERLNYQNAREALESWKEKRPKKYEINEDVKETSFNTPEKIQSELQKDNLAGVKTVEGPTVSVSASTPNSISDSGYISSTNGDSKSQTDLKQVRRKLEEHIRQSNLTLFEEPKNTLGQENLGLKPADQSQISEETKKRLREDGLLKDSSTDVKTNDSGYSSPTHANHKQSQVNPGQLKASLMNVEQRDDTLLTEFTSKLDKETQKFPLKPVDQKEMSEQTKERLSEAGLLKDGLADVKTVAEQENADTNLTIDKSSNLYKLLEKDKIQLEVGVIEEGRKDTLTEHTDNYDRNRIALGNRNKRPLDWAKRIAESQQEKDTNKGILI